MRVSEFQIAVPHGKDPVPADPQLSGALSPGLVAPPHGVWSAAGVVGLEFADEKEELVGREPFRVNMVGTSLSHDVRRMGLATGAAGGWPW